VRLPGEAPACLERRLTLPMPRGRGCSVQRRDHHPSSLPGPKYVQRGVVIAVRDAAAREAGEAGEAEVGAHTQRMGYALTARRAVLRRSGGCFHHHALTDTRCLVDKGGTKLPPARIRRRCAGVAVSYQVGDLQAFQIIQGVVGPQERQGCLVIEVAPLAFHLVVLAGEKPCCFPPPPTPLLPAREPTLCLCELLLRSAILARMIHRRARRSDRTDLQPETYPRLTFDQGQLVCLSNTRSVSSRDVRGPCGPPGCHSTSCGPWPQLVASLGIGNGRSPHPVTLSG